MKTMIAVPCYDKLDVEFVKSVENLVRVGVVGLEFVTGSLIYCARDDLSEIALRNNVDYVLWLDSDMIFNDDLLINLMKDLEEQKADVACGLFFSRRPPYNPAIWKKLRLGIGDEAVTEMFTDYPQNSVFEVDACGFAAVLMKADVLREVIKKERTAFQPIPGYGEDISFCIRAKKLGFKIICDSRVKVGHIGRTVITETTYRKWNNKEDDESAGISALERD